MDPVARLIDRLVGGRAVGPFTDGCLLERFLRDRDEAAFEALVRRHAGMVLGVCRRVLRDAHDAEDAFQATFLVLARRARSIRRRESVASWLYGVAYRTAARLKAREARRRAGARQAPAPPPADPLAHAMAREFEAVLDEELSRLPEKYRAPVVLCGLGGKTQEEAARELGWPLGSMSRRLGRGRELLRHRLARRGIAVSVTAAAGLMAETAAPAALVDGAARAALLTVGRGAAGALASARAAALADGVARAMFLGKLKVAAVVVVALAAVGVGAGVATSRVRAARAADGSLAIEGQRPAPEDPPRPAGIPGAEAAAAGRPHDWPMFGGSPDRNMVNTVERGIPTDWSVEPGKEKNIKWSVQLGSRAYGGPVIAGGRVYVGTNRVVPPDPFNAGDRGVLACFRESDGRLLWQAVHAKLPTGLVNDWPDQGIASTPAIDGDRVYYVSNRCELVCVTAGGRTGRRAGRADVVWRLDMMKELGVHPHNLATCSPLVVGDRVYAVTGNGVDESHVNVPAPQAPSFIAVNKRTGKVVWRDNSPGNRILHGQWSNPAYAVVRGTPQVIFPGGDGWLRGFDARTGALIWKFDCNPKKSVYKLQGKGTRSIIAATPVVYDNKVYVGVGDDPEHRYGVGHFWCIDITKKGDLSPVDDNFDPTADVNKNSGLVWHFGGMVEGKAAEEAARPYVFGRTISTAAIHDGLVYVAELEGILHCLDAQTGQEYWQHNLQAEQWGSPYWVDGKVYIGNDDGNLFIFQAGKKKELLNTTDMHARVRVTPAAANGVLYLLTENRLYAIGAGGRAVVPVAPAGEPRKGDARPAAVGLEVVNYRQLGQAVRERHGQVVVVAAWSTSSAPGRRALADLVRLHRRFAEKGVVCLSVSVDPADRDKTVLDYLKGQRAAFPNFLLAEKPELWQDKWGLVDVPGVWVFGREGKPVATFDRNPGHAFTETHVADAVQRILDGRPPSDPPPVQAPAPVRFPPPVPVPPPALPSVEERVQRLQAAADSVAVLAGALKDEDRELRAAAARALAEHGPAARAAVPALVNALQDAEPEVRAAALRALGKVGPAAEPVVTSIAAALRDKDGIARTSAAIALGKVGLAAVPALRQALRDPDLEVRRCAAYALGRVGPAAHAAVNDLRAALKSPDEYLRKAAAEALRQIGAGG